MVDARGYVERDSRGRQRLVIPRSSSHHRSSSRGRRSTRELLNEAEEREQTLIAQVQSLQTRLSFAERNEWQHQNLRRDHHTLVNEHHHTHAQLEAQVREVSRLEDLLVDQEAEYARLTRKNEKLEDKIHALRRESGHESYRARFEEKVMEVELLRRRLEERDEAIRLRDEAARLAETRLTEKNNTIVYLKSFLRTQGFRVEV